MLRYAISVAVIAVLCGMLGTTSAATGSPPAQEPAAAKAPSQVLEIPPAFTPQSSSQNPADGQSAASEGASNGADDFASFDCAQAGSSSTSEKDPPKCGDAGSEQDAAKSDYAGINEYLNQQTAYTAGSWALPSLLMLQQPLYATSPFQLYSPLYSPRPIYIPPPTIYSVPIHPYHGPAGPGFSPFTPPGFSGGGFRGGFHGHR